MKIKKCIASAMAAACVMTSGVFSAIPSAMAVDGNSPWLDFTLKSSSYYLKPGDTFDVEVMAHNVSGFTANLGGGQLNLHYYNSNNNGADLELVSIKNADIGVFKQFESNTETAEVAFSFLAGGKDIKQGEQTSVATYTYKVPDNAPELTTYILSIGLNSYFIDSNGDELQSEMSFANLMLNVDTETANKKSLSFNLGNDTINAVGGKEFSVPVKIYGSNINSLAGFQFKLDVPEGVEYTGADMSNIPGGVKLAFNPETFEVAAAQKDGEPIGVNSGDTIAVLNFKNQPDYSGTFSIGVTDVAGTATDKSDFTVEASRSAKVSVVPLNLRFKLDYSGAVAVGEEINVPVVIQGSGVETLAGFQLKLDIPENIAIIGADTSALGSSLKPVVNPATYEIALASKNGESLGLKDGDTIATLKLKVLNEGKNGKASIGITDVYGIDTDNIDDIINPSLGLDLIIAEPTPDIPVSDDGQGLLGDANLDGHVDAKDASAILAEYAAFSTGKDSTFTDAQQTKNADVDKNGSVDAKDASKVLAYYAFLSTGGEGKMEDWLANNK